jgi:hypothetical protein
LDINILSFIANSRLESSECISPWIQLLLGFIQEKLHIGKVCVTNTVRHELLQHFPPEIVDKYHFINIAYWNPQVIVEDLMHALPLKGWCHEELVNGITIYVDALLAANFCLHLQAKIISILLTNDLGF